MGILSGRDLLTSKYTTALIINADNRGFFIPIKYVIGDYFLAEIERQLYCFRLEGIRQITYRHTLTKSFRMLIYTTDHYLPFSPSDMKLLEDTLKHNTLPKMNRMLFNILKLLGQKEKHNQQKKDMTPHELSELVKKIGESEDQYPEQAQSIKNFIKELGTEKILTPVKKLTEFLETDLLATDPKFLGDLVTQHMRTDDEQKKMANKPLTGKFPMLKLVLIIMIIGVISGVGYWVYSSGMISNPLAMPSLPGSPANPGSANDIMTKYPTPEALKAAIDRGEVQYSSLPANIKKMVDQVKLPTVKATP